MAINYPSTLPDFRMGKARQEVQRYRTSQPFAGPLYIEQITDESPVTWDVTIRCETQIQARQFRAFLRQVCSGETFNKEIWTEEGYVTHEVRFVELPLTPTQINRNTWDYSGVIYAVKLIENDADICNDELITCNLQDASQLDCTINSTWPET